MSTRYPAYETNVDVSVVCRNVKRQTVILATGQVRDIILVQKSVNNVILATWLIKFTYTPSFKLWFGLHHALMEKKCLFIAATCCNMFTG